MQQVGRHRGSCRNAATLRDIVLAAFLAIGDVELAASEGSAAPASQNRDGRKRRSAEERQPSTGLDLDATLTKAWARFEHRRAAVLTDLAVEEIASMEANAVLAG